MHVRCPHCQNAIEVVDAVSLQKIDCPSCGNLLGEQTTAAQELETGPVTGHVAVHDKARHGASDDDPTVSNRRSINESTKEAVAAGEMETMAPKSAPTPRSNREVSGDYEIIGELARGGMGVVYKARQKKLNRIVALKMIRSGELAGDEEISRFQAEAEAVARLDHPGIVPIYEVGESDGRPYFSMGFIDGENLAAKLVEGPLSCEQAAELTIKVADAIAYAHENGVIHRDLKPANVLIDGKGEPRVTDFGLAKMTHADSSATATGQILGTPAFMPPEQASGDVANIDERADVYALGAILYTLVTGRPPFQASSPMETLIQVLADEPVRPSQLNSAIPRDVETICLKCLSKQPSRRYQSASALSTDLKHWRDGEPIMARPVSIAEKCWKWARRHPGIVGTAAVALLVLAVVVVVAQLRQNSAEASRLVQRLMDTDTTRVDLSIEALRPYLPWARDDLKAAFNDSPDDSDAKLHAALAMLEYDESVLDYLGKRLLQVSPDQFAPVRKIVQPHAAELVDEYWRIAANDKTRNFQATCALATFDPDGEKWLDEEFARDVAVQLVSVMPSHLAPWRDALAAVKESLISPLMAVYRDYDEREQLRSFATDTLTNYLADDPDRLFELLAEAEEQHFNPVFETLSQHDDRASELANAEIAKSWSNDSSEEEKEALAMRQANAAVMLYRTGRTDQVWPLLRHEPDPRVRSYIIHWLRGRGGKAAPIIDRYESEIDVTIKRALLLCLGELELLETEKQALTDTLLEDYRNDPDSGLHAAAEWILRRWNLGEKIAQIDDELQQTKGQFRATDITRQWFVNSQGQTFAIVDAGEFMMGTPESEARRFPNESLHRRNIGRRIAIAVKEVTKEQWRAFSSTNAVFSADEKTLVKFARTDDSPMGAITWYEAVHYCNWLSQQEGIPEEEWCYEKNHDDQYSHKMIVKQGFWELAGYRLPTEAEWEFACRSGAGNRRYYGSANSLLHHYAWYDTNSEHRMHVAGSLKPNDFGLFDMHGNVWEWCHNPYRSYRWEPGKPTADFPLTGKVDGNSMFILRGGAFLTKWDVIRCGHRHNNLPAARNGSNGFRPVRTMPRKRSGESNEQ